jgi:hypothetical protein
MRRGSSIFAIPVLDPDVYHPGPMMRPVIGVVSFATRATAADLPGTSGSRKWRSDWRRAALCTRVPHVEVHIVPSTEKPSSIGATHPVMIAAVCKALFALTGRSIHSPPLVWYGFDVGVRGGGR